jgi:predicted RNA binding protein YcfA (HicA-like mRNA interferase family)
MKQGHLLDELRAIAKEKGATLDFVRHGGSHDHYEIRETRLIVPRHREIPEYTARGIIRTAKGA